MAERLEDIKTLTPKRPPKYPWEEWQDGAVWRIRRGTDFKIARDNFRTVLYMRGKEQKYKVATHAEDADTLLFQFTKMTPEEEAEAALAEAQRAEARAEALATPPATPDTDEGE